MLRTVTGEVDVVKERLAMFALGMWLAGTILVSVVAAQNFYTIDRLLAESQNATFRFEMFHGLYLILEALKLAIGVVVVYWITRSRPDRQSISA